eukprot:123391_1
MASENVGDEQCATATQAMDTNVINTMTLAETEEEEPLKEEEPPAPSVVEIPNIIAETEKDVNDAHVVEMEGECNENIYNAFLIANYRSDLEWNDFYSLSREIKYGLGIFTYMVAFTQIVSLIVLIRMVQITSGISAQHKFFKSIFNDPLLPNNGYSMFTFTFFIIGIFASLNEARQTNQDILLLKTLSCNNNFHYKFLKLFVELGLGYLGSIVFLMTVAYYSNSNSWEGILNTIFNLLAYQFILDVDEMAYN